MLYGLPITLHRRTVLTIRRWLVVASVALACGLAAIGVANPSPHVASATEELLHDMPEAVSTSVAPQIVAGKHQHIVWMEVTAYCSCPKCCGPNAHGVTASGKDITYNNGKFVAADTSVLPFGTRLLINGYDTKPVEVIDRGGAIKGNKLDVYFSTHEEALRWGRQHIPVVVVD